MKKSSQKFLARKNLLASSMLLLKYAISLNWLLHHLTIAFNVNSVTNTHTNPMKHKSVTLW